LVQLILHIGTHKTGTSAVQECLHRNERILAERGIYYAHRARARSLNQLAQLFASGQSSEARALVDSHLAKARAHGATTFLISAESFFAMTMFFHKLEGEDCGDYWTAEARCIELLHDVLPHDLPKRVVVFFRRQDKFLESVYAQTVRTRPLSATCEQFAASVGEALDYALHMGISARAGDSVAAPGYPPVPRDVRFDRFGARLARIETRSATSLEAVLAGCRGCPGKFPPCLPR
jgi:hypothetical protein